MLNFGKFIIIYLLIFGFGLQAIAQDKKDAQVIDQSVLKIGANEYFLGKNDAPITIIEYSSLSCPHCAYFHQQVFTEFKEKYLDTGKVKYIQRPCPFDNIALKGAMLAVCSGNEYYTYLKILFDKQSSWVSKKNYIEILENIAKLGGMSGKKFEECVNSKEIENKILKIRLDATNKLQINATPIFFVNGQKITGAVKFDKLSSIIDEEFQKLNIK